VWHAGITSMGFPPTWIATGSELKAIQKLLVQTLVPTGETNHGD
jgi:hypothetical protein